MIAKTRPFDNIERTAVKNETLIDNVIFLNKAPERSHSIKLYIK